MILFHIKIVLRYINANVNDVIPYYGIIKNVTIVDISKKNSKLAHYHKWKFHKIKPFKIPTTEDNEYLINESDKVNNIMNNNFFL